jgi:hypothetical protein
MPAPGIAVVRSIFDHRRVAKRVAIEVARAAAITAQPLFDPPAWVFCIGHAGAHLRSGASRLVRASGSANGSGAGIGDHKRRAILKQGHLRQRDPNQFRRGDSWFGFPEASSKVSCGLRGRYDDYACHPRTLGASSPERITPPCVGILHWRLAAPIVTDEIARWKTTQVPLAPRPRGHAFKEKQEIGKE